ncbi:MAG TPA: galactosyltransferase-related protein [Pyrinomonadaceae bacterium]|jgi:hypothetical protein
MSNSSAPRLSLLTAYRRRESHLQVLLTWLARARAEEGFTDFELVLVEGDERPTAAAAYAERYDWVRYLHVEMSGRFHKTMLLNRAFDVSRGEFLIHLDADLLPARGVLGRHLSLAAESPRCLISGYRLQLPWMLDPGSPLPTSQEVTHTLTTDDTPYEQMVCSEDDATTLCKYLLKGERFGVCPCFPRNVYAAVGGMDETFVGWGADDQDLMESICARGYSMVRSYDILYFHLPHEHERDWADPELTAENRKLLTARREQRRLLKERSAESG